jgi:hypothetical protein
MNAERFRFLQPDELIKYRDATIQLARDSWPQFMWQGAAVKDHWGEFFERFRKYQSVLLDESESLVVAVGHSLPFRWDQDLADLPEEGWDWVIEKAVQDNKNGVATNILAAVFVGVHEEYKKHGLSRSILLSFQPTARAHGFENLVIPVRPNEKPNYPLIGIDDYISWKNEAGMPFDAWLRIQVRAGGKFIKVCHRSKTVRGSRAEWELWTGMKFPQSGRYIVSGALEPMEMDIEKDEGIYIEPNVWTLHKIG